MTFSLNITSVLGDLELTFNTFPKVFQCKHWSISVTATFSNNWVTGGPHALPVCLYITAKGSQRKLGKETEMREGVKRPRPLQIHYGVGRAFYTSPYISDSLVNIYQYIIPFRGLNLDMT